MSRFWTFTAVHQKDAPKNDQESFGILYKPIQFLKKLSRHTRSTPTIRGCVESYDLKEAKKMARGQIRRLYPNYVILEIKELKEWKR